MKCIVIETSPERTNAHTVTNEDGTPHIYATMKEAREELKANGYSYNRANDRYYLADAPEYRAYIIREDSEEYAHTIEQAEQDAAPEYIEPEPYQRAELEAYLGEPDDYDVNSIEHEATAYDPATGRTVWNVGPEELASICERYQIAEYLPAV